jgi:site-specific recombinase XerD
MTDHLPSITKPGHLTALPDSKLIPSLIADAGEQAAWRYVDFFTANIRNPNTRPAYARASVQFFAWCEDRGLRHEAIRSYDVATYIETLQQTHAAPSVKQLLAAVRMLFNWLICEFARNTDPLRVDFASNSDPRFAL